MWESQVQEYFNGPHNVAGKLTSSVSVAPGSVEVSIGYPEEVEASSTGRIVRMVLFGTTKMQPRNFLKTALERVEDTIPADVSRVLESVFSDIVLQ